MKTKKGASKHSFQHTSSQLSLTPAHVTAQLMILHVAVCTSAAPGIHQAETDTLDLPNTAVAAEMLTWVTLSARAGKNISNNIPQKQIPQN